jgi:4-hydroxy-2-oxoheptanedioate aldolase
MSSLGIFSKTSDSNLIEASGYAGFDFVILDMEHGPNDRITIHHHARAAQVGGLKSIVRVKSCDENEIGSALDAGVDGVQVPNISSAEMALKAVRAARFAPLGERGVCRFVKDAQFGKADRKVYFSEANKKLLVLQVEGKEGVAAIDAIMQIPGFDILFIGPYDLSQSLGIPGEIEDPRIFELCESLVSKAQQNGLGLGIFVDDLKQAKKYKDLGFTYIAYSVDLSLYREAASSLVRSFKTLA